MFLLQSNVTAAQVSPLLLSVSADPLSVVKGATKLCHLLHQIFSTLQGNDKNETVIIALNPEYSTLC